MTQGWPNPLRSSAGCAGLILTLALCAPMVEAEPLPPSVAAVIDAAAATGKPETLKTVVDLIKKTNPNSVAEIDAQVAALKAKAEKVRLAKMANQGLLEGIKGEGQIGFSNSTDESKTINLALGLKVTKESLHWKNSLTLKADFERENGVTSEEQYLVGYENRYKLSSRQYILTSLNWERDPFEGFSSRLGASIGLGYNLINTPTLSFSLDAGPAVRRIAYVAVPSAAAYTTNEAAGRLGASFSWTIVPKTTLTETVTGFIGNGDKSMISIIAITTKLGGALSGRVSYEVDYDSLRPVGYADIATLGRLTLVYGF